MDMTVFESVKDAVTVPEVAREYGFTPNKAGFIRCPFHQERTPSMKLYKNQFHCYGCGAHGTVIDFVKDLFHMSALDAVKRLDADFGLHLVDGHHDHGEAQDRRKIEEAQDVFCAWRDDALYLLCEFVRLANTADYDDLSEAQITAIKYLELMVEWIENLESKRFENQMAVFRDREGVSAVCGKILKSTMQA